MLDVKVILSFPRNLNCLNADEKILAIANHLHLVFFHGFLLPNTGKLKSSPLVDSI